MVTLIQNILTKNLEAICRVILAKTSQKMIMNLLMMVLINLPIIKFTCQHHISGYVCRVWHLFFFFFLLLIEIISVAKLWITVHFFVLKHEKQTLRYIHTKFVGAPVFVPQHWKLLGPERLVLLELLCMNRVNHVKYKPYDHTDFIWSVENLAKQHSGFSFLVTCELSDNQGHSNQLQTSHNQKVYFLAVTHATCASFSQMTCSNFFSRAKVLAESNQSSSSYAKEPRCCGGKMVEGVGWLLSK